MSMYQHQSQVQKQGLNTFLLQQKLQILHLMHLPSLALEEYIKNQLEENPALEEVNEDGAVTSDEAPELRDTEEGAKLTEIAEYFEDDDVPDYKTYVNNRSKDEPDYSFTAVYYESFQEQLKDQLNEYQVAPEKKHLIEYLIDSLDEDGYLHISVSDLAEAYGFANGHFIEESVVEEALHALQQFDPPGIGAQSLQQCLLLQLKRKKN